MRSFTISFQYILLSIPALAFAGGHPAGGTLPVTFYSHSMLSDKKTQCEGSRADRQLADGSQFDDGAVEQGTAPKVVAMASQHHAKGCKIKFTSGEWTGQTADVRDINGSNTIDVAIKTDQAKDKKECQKILRRSVKPVSYELTDCPGARGTKGSSRRAKGTGRRL